MSKTKTQSSTAVKTSTQVITRLIEQSNWRTRQDITSWRSAIQTAESMEHPNRSALYALYDEVLLDAHIQGLLLQRTNRLLAQPFRLVDAAGNDSTETKSLFDAEWFYKLLTLIMESNWWGHSLVQLWDAQTSGYSEVSLVPRRHVVPDWGSISIKQGDFTKTALINYRNTNIADWLIEAGDSKAHGLFKMAAPSFLLKKNALMQWSQYTEIFGMPMRVGKTASRQQQDMERMANNLSKMGSAAYAVFQEGETIDFIESTKGDAYNVYDKLIERCNSELSKLILGQTLTADAAKSGTRAQGEVHERVVDAIAESDKRMVQQIINGQLLPRMAMHGYNVQGLRFEWNAGKDMDSLWQKTTQAMSHFDVDAAWIRETFGIPVVKI